MTQRISDRILETWTGTGTGALTLAGAVTGFVTFGSQYADADTVFYVIENPGTAEWEIGEGTMASSGASLQRTTQIASSNAGSLVNFTSGIKLVFCNPPAIRLATQTGQGTDTAVPFYDSRGQLTSNAGFLYSVSTSTQTVQHIRATGSLGYPVGTGGLATQLTSKSTAVVLAKITGELTTHNSSLPANTSVSFIYTNSLIAAGDHVLVSHISGGTVGAYNANALAAAGSATITLRNLTTSTLGEALVLKATVFKAATT